MIALEKTRFSSTERMTIPSRILPKWTGDWVVLNSGIFKQIEEIWIKNIQKDFLVLPVEKSLFDDEKNLLKTLSESSSTPEKHTIVQFCNILQNNALKEYGTSAVLDIAKGLIGQIIFLAEKNGETTSSLLDLSDVQNSIKRIQQAFKSEIHSVQGQLKDYQIQHDKAPIQNSSLSLSIQKPLAIASFLITSKGQLNLGLIDSLKKNFFGPKSTLLQYERELLQTLDDLKHSAKMQQRILKVSKPLSPFFISNDLIRISLQLPSSSAPTDRQTRIVALAALLSDIRQGDLGGCYASCTPLMMMRGFKNKILSDFGDILTNGKLSNIDSDSATDFISAFDLEDPSLKALFSIDIEGKVQSGTGFLWNAPGIIAATQQLNLFGSSVKNAVKNAIEHIYRKKNLNPSDLIEISAADIIEDIINIEPEFASLTSLQAQDLKNLALFAFISETANPLLNVWENCMAAIAEANGAKNIHQKVFNCLCNTLENQWTKRFSKISHEAAKVKKIFQRTLKTGIHLRYDEQTEFKINEDSKGPSFKVLGAFILHELNQGERTASTKKISTPEEFRAFVTDCLKKVQEIFRSIKPLANGEKYRNLIDRILDYVNKSGKNHDVFLKNCLRCYDNENKNLSNPMQNWEELEHLPFRDAIRIESLNQYYPGTRFASWAPEIVRPKNAQELLEAFLAYSQRFAEQRNAKKETPSNNSSAKIQENALMPTPEDPSIIEAIYCTLPFSEWIQKRFFQPGKAICSLRLTLEQKNQFILAASKLLPLELSAAFLSSLDALRLENDSVYLFSQQLLNALLSTINRKDELSKTFLSAKLTNILIKQILPEAAIEVLNHSAVQIAESRVNEEEAKPLHFVCFFDPVTNALQLGMIHDDSKRFEALDQSEWASYVPWEMYGICLTPLLNNHSVEVLEV